MDAICSFPHHLGKRSDYSGGDVLAQPSVSLGKSWEFGKPQMANTSFDLLIYRMVLGVDVFASCPKARYCGETLEI